jgi:hypothetical protein
MPSDLFQQPAAPEAPHPERPKSGLNFLVAGTLPDVEEAWGLVYQAYRRDNLIDANPQEIHTTKQAVGPQTAVILACLGPVLAGTLSVYADGASGIPLDSVYRPEIDGLRQSGRRLMEVGLFADRREHINRSADGLFELMRYAYYFALSMKVDDALIGVHPRHAPFYMRMLGFDRIGPVRSYPTVKDRAVVLLRHRVSQAAPLERTPKGLAYFLENPVGAEAFARRFRFDEASLAGSRIAMLLAGTRAATAA